MEEEGTEILFRPGTETLLTKHFSSQGEKGKSAELNLLEYCTTEATDEAKSNRDVPSTCSRSSEGGENLSFTSPSTPSTDEEQRQESSTNRAFFPESTQEQPSQPSQPSQPTVNRFDSLVENATTDEDDGSVSSDHNDNSEKNGFKYHPALKAAVYTEGQEAVWHEDEYSTISSIYVKPEKNTTSATTTEVLPTHSQNFGKKMKVPFFKSRGKKVQKDQPISEEVEPTPRPVKIHIKKKRIAKSVLLLPSKEAGVETNEENASEDTIKCIKENERFASITENSIQARRLLETVLSGDGLDEEESERFAKEAFNHATTARRLAHHSENNEKESDIADDDDSDEEAIELENVMSYLAEEGGKAAMKHRRQYSIDEENNDQGDKNEYDQEGAKYSNAIDLTMMEANESAKVKKKRRGKFPASGYASRAVHYLESILPKNIENKKGDDDGDASPDDGSISTLGLKNDTLEYGLNTDEGGDDANNNLDHDGVGLPRTVDMMSLSSLNEILDGGGTVNDKLENNGVLNQEVKRQKQSLGEISPRAAVQEIGIPRKMNSELPPIHPRQNRAGIFGLLAPKIAKPSDEINTKQQVVEDDNNNNKTWGVFFKTPRANDGVPSQLNLVLEKQEGDRSEVPKHEEISSSTSPNSAEKKGDNLESTISKESDPSETEKIVEGDTDSYLDMPEANRYAPAFEDEESGDKYQLTNEIEMELSVASNKDQNSESAGGDDDALSENIVRLQSPSSQEEMSITSANDVEARIDLSVASDEKSNDYGNRDRYQTEPVGKTPRRDGLDFEENTNRKFNVDESVNKEESCLPTPFEQHAALTVKKEDQGDQKSESISHDKNLNEKAAMKKTSANKGPSHDSIKTPNPDSESSVEDETKPIVANKLEEVAVKGNDEKETIQTNFKPGALPNKSSSRTKKAHAKSDSKFQRSTQEEMSTAGSEGSKTKIFGRVVDIVEQNKRKPLVPIAIVEEKYFVDKDMKKISAGVNHIHKSRKPSKTISKMTDTPIISSPPHVDDIATVVQNAISNGNLKAVESNEEGDNIVPLNYLSAMLRKKLCEEKVKALKGDSATDTGEPQRASEDTPDADSFVAAIRGPRLKEAPGVALEEIAIRNYENNRDPIIGNGIKAVIIDLAPTPRRPKGSTFDDDKEEAKNDTREDERQRRRLITERLFQAGSSSVQDEATTKKKTSGDIIMTAPTVESAESYCDEPILENVDHIESEANKEIIEKNEEHSRTKLGRGRRLLSISFLKGSKRK